MRIARTWAPLTVYHFISRFIDARWFIKTDEDRRTYLRLLGAALRESDWRCIGYALMSNHIHLALIAGQQSMSSWVRRVHPPFAIFINDRQKRIGPVFAGRPKLHSVDDARVAALLGYIHNNPVRAGVVRGPELSSWTSARAFLGLVEPPPWLALEQGFTRAGRGEEAPACVVSGELATPDQAALAGLYRGARRAGGLLLGTPSQAPTRAAVLAYPHSRARPDPRAVLAIVGALLDLSPLAFCGSRRQPALLAARRLSVRAGIALGLTGTAMADALGISRQSASRHALTPLAPAEHLLVARVVQAAHVDSTLGVQYVPPAMP